ncbi:MAG TPA: CoA-transferase [Candidatus Dormibacteraeota bacterium]|nr:CoA-transferase [Candidatus Dormibacteraeota bacterium]
MDRLDKRATMAEGAGLLPEGGHLALCGFAISRNAVSFVHELIRAGRAHLHLTQVVGGLETDLLVAAGLVDRLTYGGGSLDRFGPLASVNRAAVAGQLELFEYSALALSLRLHAGALGLPYLPTRSMLGSDLLDSLMASGEVRLSTDPFSDSPCLLLSPLRPDLAVAHVDRADRAGNCSIEGPVWSIPETVRAARAVLVVCEQIVEMGELDPSRVTIPGEYVTAVAVSPRGAHPTAVFGRYDYDRKHLELYEKAATSGEEASREYLERWVLGVADEQAYLEAAAG